ncbi:hypothetical protein HHK36_021794 [Tetracentron sinense]|uniref:Uncharacterized protein n=1 Tax=Tetracentron sinense TaxID=13715 RepID=A0A834YTR9_TETSI|nr:hypothetical protein HHK36_021794 [Tetracentron sinense]
MGSRPSSNEKLVAIGLAILSVISPLYIDRKPAIEEEDDDESISLTSWLPLLLMVLIGAIYLSRYLDQSFKKFDPYWIHRVGGSSCGIIMLLMVLALVLKCKASMTSWEA